MAKCYKMRGIVRSVTRDEKVEDGVVQREDGRRLHFKIATEKSFVEPGDDVTIHDYKGRTLRITNHTSDSTITFPNAVGGFENLLIGVLSLIGFVLFFFFALSLGAFLTSNMGRDDSMIWLYAFPIFAPIFWILMRKMGARLSKKADTAVPLP